MKSKLAECGAPRSNQSVLYVERLKAGDSQTFVVYSSKLYGFFTHWTGSKTVPCWEDHSLCEGGHKEETLRQNYLLQAYSTKLGKQVFVYLTPTAAESLLSQLPSNASLRGMSIRVTRTAKDKGRLWVQLEEHTQARRITAPEIDPYDSIMRFCKVPTQLQLAQRSLGTIPVPAEDLSETA